MSYYASQLEVSFDFPPTGLTRAQGGFDKDDDEVIGRWVEMHSDGSVKLVLANQKPLGVITRFSSGKVAVALGPFVKGKQAGTTAIPEGSGVTGATKAVVASGTPEPGFVAAGAAGSVANAVGRTGVVIESADTTANTEGVASTQVLMWA